MADVTKKKDYLLWLGATADDAFDDLAAALDVTEITFTPEREDTRTFTQETRDTGGIVTSGPTTYSGTIKMIRREGQAANETQFKLLDTTAKTAGARLTGAIARGAIGTGESSDTKIDGWIGELALKESSRNGDASSSDPHVYEWEYTLEDAYVIATNTVDPRPT